MNDCSCLIEATTGFRENESAQARRTMATHRVPSGDLADISAFHSPTMLPGTAGLARPYMRRRAAAAVTSAHRSENADSKGALIRVLDFVFALFPSDIFFLFSCRPLECRTVPCSAVLSTMRILTPVRVHTRAGVVTKKKGSGASRSTMRDVLRVHT